MIKKSYFWLVSLFFIPLLAGCGNNQTAEIDADLATAESYMAELEANATAFAAEMAITLTATAMEADANPIENDVPLEDDLPVESDLVVENEILFEHGLGGGILLTYEHNGVQSVEAIPVHDAMIFPRYEFPMDSPDTPEDLLLPDGWYNNTDIKVRFAWYIAPNETAGTLYYNSYAISPTLMLTETTVLGWQEYLLVAQVDEANGTTLVTESSDVLPVNASLEPSAMPDSPALLNKELIASDNGQPLVQLLLTFTSETGHVENVLILFMDTLATVHGDAPEPPAGGDSLAQNQCSRCYRGFCRLSCWFWRVRNR